MIWREDDGIPTASTAVTLTNLVGAVMKAARYRSAPQYYHHGLLDPRIPHLDPIKGRLRYP